VSLEPPAATAPLDPVKADYDAAADLLKAQRYDAAQQAFTAFLQKHPGTRYNAPAIYHYGESYYYQNRHREAAEQFLKIATDYAKSSVAPGAMVKLGVSLNALGAKEQACAFFAEVPHKYPNASASEKQAATREAKKAAC
jgi:tol-pal system protein YbgF